MKSSQAASASWSHRCSSIGAQALRLTSGLVWKKILLARSHMYWEPLIGASLTSSVVGHGSLVPGRALWVGLDKGSSIFMCQRI